MSVRVRFAPSPTGFLHVGGARTALFNWLFARHHGGTFVLRVEDTDVAREKPEFRAEIFRALGWLGIDEDEGPNKGGPYGPYTQRERLSHYRDAAEKLRAQGSAYPCFCGSREDVSYERETSDDEPEDVNTKSALRCPCALLSEEEVAAKTVELGTVPALRMRVDAARPHAVDDLIRGHVEFPPGEVEDFIITKAGGDPLYNFCAVVDDAAMHITHVIRGEEHLANTPKQLALYEALELPAPRFAHIPIILNAERKKLSKRDGSTAVSDYRRLGYLPEALRNFLALLGWNPGDDREIMPLPDLVAAFELDRVQKHGAVFDVQKLTWMNGEYVKTAPVAELIAATRELLAARADGAALRSDDAHVAAVWELMRERAKTIAELVNGATYFFSTATTIGWDPDAVQKRAGTPESRMRLRGAADALRAIRNGAWNRTSVEAAIRGLATQTGTKAGEYIGAIRVAITGNAVSAGLFETAEVLGRELTLGRIDAFLAAFPETVTA